jgi:FAD/FMN-containing dehydrogenase
MRSYQSWGRYPKSEPSQIVPLHWLSEIQEFRRFPKFVLPHGQGRSYGDCCLNNGGVLLDTLGLDRFIGYDVQTGILQCEAGVSLDAILQLIVPKGWFLPATPGTQFVTVGGAVANDIHGKNHHCGGSFGCHVKAMEVLRSDGERVLCTPDRNAALFRATIGGMGLTGLILWVEFRLQPIAGPYIASEQIRFRKLDEFFELSAESDKSYEYTVAWVDCVSPGQKLGRGIFMRGNHSPRAAGPHAGKNGKGSLARGFEAPELLINRASMRAFNSIYFHRQRRDTVSCEIPYEKFFYPLDAVRDWNRLYGTRGFLQYQCVVPYDHRQAVQDILELIARSRQVCTLAVLKVFGEIASPGMLSFPRPGVTLAMDFPMQGRPTLELCERFDEIVRGNGGAVYPAKDARMSAVSYQAFFPAWQAFAQFKDPHFSSSLWRRVTAAE